MRPESERSMSMTASPYSALAGTSNTTPRLSSDGEVVLERAGFRLSSATCNRIPHNHRLCASHCPPFQQAARPRRAESPGSTEQMTPCRFFDKCPIGYRQAVAPCEPYPSCPAKPASQCAPRHRRWSRNPVCPCGGCGSRVVHPDVHAIWAVREALSIQSVKALYAQGKRPCHAAALHRMPCPPEPVWTPFYRARSFPAQPKPRETQAEPCLG